MGLFDGLVGDIAGPLVAGGMSLLGGQQQASANEAMVSQQEGFQERMSDTSYQRGMADMQKAGLNPMLAYQQGGASTPTGSSLAQPNILGGAVSSAMDAIRIRQQSDMNNAAIRKTGSDIDVNTAHKGLLDKQGQAADAAAKRDAVETRKLNAMMPMVEKTSQMFLNNAGNIQMQQKILPWIQQGLAPLLNSAGSLIRGLPPINVAPPVPSSLPPNL